MFMLLMKSFFVGGLEETDFLGKMLRFSGKIFFELFFFLLDGEKRFNCFLGFPVLLEPSRDLNFYVFFL